MSDTRCSQCFRYLDDAEGGLLIGDEWVCTSCSRQWERTSDPPRGQSHDPKDLKEILDGKKAD